MKKLLITLVLVFATGFGYSQQRPYRIGIKGGVNFVHLENYGSGFYSDFEPKPGISLGALFQYTWGGNFLKYSLVPELQFTQSRTDVDLLYITDCMATIQTVDLLANFKLGLQLSKIFRPYLLATIYGSYLVTYSGDFFELLDIDHTQPGATINRVYYGVGAGIGFDLWKFQVEGRYRWNLNRIQTDDYSALKQMGLEFSLAFLF
jgi:hypothetical protein